MASVRCALFALALFALLNAGSALRCYYCSSVAEPSCNDHFNRTAEIHSCMPEQVCVKYKTPLILTTNRGCQVKNFCETVEEFSKHCSVCTTDLCNSAPAVIPSFAAIALLVVKNYLL